MEINGLPVHALVIHGAVVFGPLAGLLAIGYVVPPLRDRLRVPLLATAVLAAGFVVAAYLSGRSYLDDNPALGSIPAVQTHQDRAAVALWVVLAFAVVAIAATLLHRRGGPALRAGLGALLVVGAVGSVVSVVLTGDAGAQAMWGGGS